MKVNEVKVKTVELAEYEIEAISTCMDCIGDIMNTMKYYEASELYGKNYSGDVEITSEDLRIMYHILSGLLSAEEMA